MKVLALLSIAGCLCLSFVANAQVPSCCDPMNMPVICMCGNTLSQGLIRIQSDVKIVQKDKMLKDGKEIANTMNKTMDMTGVPTKVMYGATDWVTLQLALPYMKKEMNMGKMENSSSGIGDIMLMSKWRLIRGRPKRPALACNLGVKFPTGDDEGKPPLGTGGYDLVFGGLISKGVGKASFYGNLIQRFTFKNSSTDVNPGDITTINVAAAYRIAEIFLLVLEANSDIVSKDKQGSKVIAENGATVYLTPGIKINPIQPLVMEACVQVPLRQPDGLAGDYIPYFGAMYTF